MLFTKIMKFRILELVNENYEDIHPSTRSAEANKRVNAAWERITNSMNDEFPSNIVSTKQIKECFKYLKKVSREQLSRIYNYRNEQNMKKEIDENSSESKSPIPDNSISGMLEHFLCGIPGVISNINDDTSEMFQTSQSDSSTSGNCSYTNVEVNGESDHLISSKKRPHDDLMTPHIISKKPKINCDNNDETNILKLQKSLLEAKLELTKKKTETLDRINNFYEVGGLFFKAGIKFFENKNE